MYSAARCAALLALVSQAPLVAQLAWWGTPIPKRDKPPVVFVTGHDALCPSAVAGEIPYFNLTFGDFDKVMERDGRVSLVFEACYAPNRPPIEEIANVFRRLMSYLSYEGGEPVREVDVVAHSMGGLIVRSYLAGKQTDGSFQPPPAPSVRKIVFIGTPHFGTPVATMGDIDLQVREMALGSPFLFDLATWNQGSDDLRGADAMAIAGTGGKNGPATDSVVTLTSASVGFAFPNRTAVLPYCHTQGGIGQLFLCEAAPGLARVKDETHPTAQLVLSFLNGGEAWRPSSAHPVLSANTSLMVRSRTASDEPLHIRSASLIYDNGRTVALEVNQAGIAYADLLPAGSAQIDADGVRRRVVLVAGVSRALVVKPGPLIEAVEPASGAVAGRPRVLAPGMLVAVRGSFPGGDLTLGGKPVEVVSVSEDGLLAVFPEDAAGLMELLVRNAGGRHSVRVMVEDALPALFVREGFVAAAHTGSGRAVTREDPAQPGETIALFLTGLGATVTRDGLRYAVRQPAVTVGGRACEVRYAGRAPGNPGMDQINCRLPDDLPVRSARVEVASGARTALGELAVR